MNRWFRLLVCSALSLLMVAVALAEDPIKPIPRRLPPESKEPLDPAIQAKLQQRLKDLRGQFQQVADHPLAADAEVYLKSVELALHHGEFYKKGEEKLATEQLDTAAARIESLSRKRTPWARAKGLVVRGFRSRIDDSPQPYGLVIPERMNLAQKVPLYVWLHGRGDTKTDLHFIRERENSKGQITPSDAIVVHPFGRQCVGFKSAGEIDVLEAIEHVQEHYNIDPDRIVLMGFSMGGAGAWHIGAHYTDRFVAMSPGAGFAETARYVNLKKENYPPEYEQRLWGAYDVPNYARNLFNLKVVAYSGEEDKQIQAARVMEEAFASHGKELTHLIGPGMGHKYHADTLAEILDHMKTARDQGRSAMPRNVALQTQTLRYNQMHWVRILGLDEHWRDTQVDASAGDGGQIKLRTENVRELALDLPPREGGWSLVIDGQSLKSPTEMSPIVLHRQDKTWALGADPSTVSGLAKRPGLQGPIDDAFMAPFLVVLPSGKAASEKVQRWIDFESAHMQERWKNIFRGTVRVKQDTEVTPEDLQTYHLICWGTPQSNSLLGRAMPGLPLSWDTEEVRLGEQVAPAQSHVPVMIYPNPLNPEKYLVINSGPTFREAHDSTNSQQNPKLPDWAIVDLSQDPSASSPGKIKAAGFFDERWRVKE